MGHRRTAMVALAVTALATSGCGGSGSTKALSQAELTAKANTICNHLRAQLTAASKQSTKEPAHLFSQTAAYEQTAQTELEKLTPPAALANDWEQIIATMGTLAQDSTKYSEYFKAKNTSGTQALANSYGSLKLRTLETAKANGLTACVL